MSLYKHYPLSKIEEVLWIYGQVKICRPFEGLGKKEQKKSQFCFFDCITQN